MNAPAAAVPRPLKLALAGVLLEALCLVVAAAAFVTGALLSGAGGGRLEVVVPLAVLLIGFAVLLAGAVRAQWRGMRWGRGPLITWQLLQAITALAAVDILPGLVIAGVLALSAAIVTGILWPSSREHASNTRSPGALV